jgi:hypothetical protein
VAFLLFARRRVDETSSTYFAAKAPIAFAARPDPPAAFCIADESQVIRSTNRSPAGPGRADFYSRPGQELAREFSRPREK